MNRERYEAYVALRDAVAGEHERAAHVLGDLAEAMLLSRQAIEAQEARDRVGDELTELVGQGDLTRAAADRTWALMRDCGPPMYWPRSWDRHGVGPRRWAMRGP